MPVLRLDQRQQRLPFRYSQRISGQRGCRWRCRQQLRQVVQSDTPVQRQRHQRAQARTQLPDIARPRLLQQALPDARLQPNPCTLCLFAQQKVEQTALV
ncbi:hypothetical protein D3C76_1632460 [compost metagenome]